MTSPTNFSSLQWPSLVNFDMSPYLITYRLLGVDDPAEQLVLQSLHGDGKVDDGGAGRDLGRIGRVGQFGGQVELEALHHVHLFIAHFHLVTRADLKVP